MGKSKVPGWRRWAHHLQQHDNSARFELGPAKLSAGDGEKSGGEGSAEHVHGDLDRKEKTDAKAARFRALVHPEWLNDTRSDR